MARKGNVPWNKGKHLPGPMEGKKHSEDAKEKMRIAKLGKPSNHNTTENAFLRKKRWRDFSRRFNICSTVSEEDIF